MTAMIPGADIRTLNMGLRVEKTIASTTNGSQAIFTIAGMVLVKAIVGEVVVAFDGTTTSLNLTTDPTIGAAVDICAATVVTSDVVGTIYSYVGGVPTTLLVSSGTAAPGEAYAPKPSEAFFQPGQIFHKGTATDAGSVKWRIFYVPIADGASIVAA